jgi:hypothetical protein
MKSEFAEWFVAQHKSRDSSGMPNHTDQQLRDMVQVGRVAERVLACRELWDEKQRAALYAWQARETTPNARDNRAVTMAEMYGDGSDHEARQDCGMCRHCGDCKCAPA